MNYKKIYNNLIGKRLNNKPDGYVERHHIQPKSLGGSNKKENLVFLTAREHFIAHLLLVKMQEKGSLAWTKMVTAFMRMYSKSSNQNRYCPSKWYSYSKEIYAKAQSISQKGDGNSQFGTIWVYNDRLQISKKIKKEDYKLALSNGWMKGRVVLWDKHKQNDNKHKEILKNRNIRECENEAFYTKYYNMYSKIGWKKFVEITGYDKTRANLVQQFRRYVKDFTPHPGKRNDIYLPM